MRTYRPFPAGSKEKLEVLLKETKHSVHFKRVQCCWLRVAFNLPAENIAQTVGWSTQTVYQVHSAYLKDGETALEPQSHGGRRRANLLLAEEEALLANFGHPSKRPESSLHIRLTVRPELVEGLLVEGRTVRVHVLRQAQDERAPPRQKCKLENEGCQISSLKQNLAVCW